MLFCQFDAYSRRLGRGQGGVLRYVPAALWATPTQKTRKMAKKPERVLPNGQKRDPNAKDAQNGKKAQSAHLKMEMGALRLHGGEEFGVCFRL